MPACFDTWNTYSFLIEMKPKSEFASVFVSCPKSISEGEVEPHGLLKLDEQMIELTIDFKKHINQKSNQSPLIAKRMGVKFCDIILDPTSVCLTSWADQHDLLMCKIKAEVDCINFSKLTINQKSIRILEEELSQYCNLCDYLERIENGRTFNVVCRQCENVIHTHNRNEYEFGILPCDDWLDLSPQMEYFCAYSGECCSKHLENELNEKNLLQFSSKFGSDYAKLLPSESRIILSNLFIFFQKNVKTFDNNTKEVTSNSARENIILCGKCNVQLGTSLRNNPNVLRLHLTTLNVHAENKTKTLYITTRFNSMESFLAWLILNKCEMYSSMKLLFRSLDKMPQLLIWLIEPHVVLTRGILNEQENGTTSSNLFPTSISYPALKVIYKLFDSNSCHQYITKLITRDPRANGNDSSVGILDVPLGCCIELAEILLNSSLAIPIPMRALGQFYVCLFSGRIHSSKGSRRLIIIPFHNNLTHFFIILIVKLTSYFMLFTLMIKQPLTSLLAATSDNFCGLTRLFSFRPHVLESIRRKEN
ncbi:hypothetical protein Mgra_00009223 [Meloidogyne graminicola]|uniref:E3 ubiquitin-protein ligase E3D n=1 Tax=Meloidogyne graminicola TaxID=189291 RepID=A0A8S9ZDN0_9BILA|nr:hypothetical protein Mgra_00009223 [Meloidogyne graminicola]